MSMLGKRNKARSKAENNALFQAMLKEGKHKVVTPEKFKGTRQSNKNKAIRESRDNGWRTSSRDGRTTRN